MTILSFFTLNIPIRRLWTNLYHKEDHFLKIWPLLHYFSEIYLKICDLAIFNFFFFFCPLRFIERCFHENELKKTIKQVAKMNRNELLRDQIRENKDIKTILVSTWHPKLSAIPSNLKHNFHLISSNLKLSKTFTLKPTVTYRKNKSLSDHLLKNDIANQQLHSNVTPCRKCKLCPQMNTTKLITNGKLNITEKTKGTGNCKEKEIIYAAQCSKYKELNIRHTGEQLSERFSKHRHDIKNRPDNSELAKYYHEIHNLNNDLNKTILQNNIKTAAARRYHEDKLICKLKTLAPHGLNTEIGDCAKEMYNFC